jgi:hypothetical protein
MGNGLHSFWQEISGLSIAAIESLFEKCNAKKKRPEYPASFWDKVYVNAG